MKARLTVLILLFFSFTTFSNVVEAKVTGGGGARPSNPPRSYSAPIKSNPSLPRATTPSAPLVVVPSSAPVINNNSRINNSINKTGTQNSMQINTGSAPVTKPVNASYKPQQVNTTRPTNTKVLERSYIAPNPNNLPTERRFVTRYDNAGVAITLPIVIPLGGNVDTYSSYYNDRFPTNVSIGYRSVTPPPVVVDNTPTNGWDVFIIFIVIGGIAFVVIVTVALSRN